MRILISGFEAFGGQAINPTAQLVEWLQKSDTPEELGLGAGAGSGADAGWGGEIRTVLLPVTFEEAFEKLDQAIRDFSPDVVLACGQARGRKEVCLERVAINCLDADIPDNSGHQPRDLPIEPAGAPAYFATLPLRQLECALKAKGIPVRISDTAGTYVCNFLMYRLLEKSVRSTRRAGFIHFPILPEQAKSLEQVKSSEQGNETSLTSAKSEPTMPFEQMKVAMTVMIQTLCFGAGTGAGAASGAGKG